MVLSCEDSGRYQQEPQVHRGMSRSGLQYKPHVVTPDVHSMSTGWSSYAIRSTASYVYSRHEHTYTLQKNN